MKHSVIGRTAIVRYNKSMYGVTVMDAIHDTNKAKRVRIQTKGPLQGKVLVPSEYTLIEFI